MKPEDQIQPLTFLQALFLLFLGLKLVGTIDWSWWAVAAPLAGAFLASCVKEAKKRKL